MATQPNLSEPVLDPQAPLVKATDPWDDNRAFAIAKSDFDYDSAFRNQNHDRRFWESDRLFQGWVDKKTWEGTRIPRASVPVFMLLTQIMGILPQVVGALFPDSLPFDCDPRPGSTWEMARAARNLLLYQISDLGENEYDFRTMREVILRAMTSELMYGNLVIEVAWLQQKRPEWQWERQVIPRRTMMPDQMGSLVAVPTGQFDIQTSAKLVDRLINKPIARNTDIRDFYVDANCPSSNIQEGRRCHTRHFYTVDELQQMALDDRIKLPPEAELVKLSQQKRSQPADQSKAFTEVYRGNSWQPAQDQTNDPNQKRVECIRSFYKTRQVWRISGWNQPIYNQPAEGFFPFVTSSFIPIPGRWYGMSVADLVEGDQKLAEALLNSRLDELNLLIHPPIIRKRGSQFAQSQYRMRPGAQWEVDGDPSHDVIRMEMGNVTANAYIEYEALERRVQKTTSVTDLQQGVASSGGNSALRSATGVATQQQNTGRRMTFQVENIEDQVIVPILFLIHSYNKRYLDEMQAIEVLGPEAKFIEIDPLYIKNCNVQFRVLAASKMRSRAMMQAGGLQNILGAILNPGVNQMFSQVGMVPNVKALSGLVADTYQLPEQALWIEMTQEQQAMMQQPSPDKMIADKMQQDRLAAQGEHQAAKDDTSLMSVILNKISSNEGLQQAATGYRPKLVEPKPAAKK